MNSTYDALVCVDSLINTKKEEMHTLFATYDLRPLSGEEIAFLKEYLTIMGPLAQALDIIHGEKDVTIAYLIPTITSILEEWKAIGVTDLAYCTGWLGELTIDLERRSSDDLSSKDFKVATVLHPKFKNSWISVEKVDELNRIVKDALSKFETASQPAAAATALQESSPAEKSLFWRMEKTAAELRQQETCSLYNLWSDWCKSNSTSVPTSLPDAYIKYNTSIPSSAAVERVFSLAKRLLNPNQTLLGDDAFEWLVMLPLLTKIEL